MVSVPKELTRWQVKDRITSRQIYKEGQGINEIPENRREEII